MNERTEELLREIIPPLTENSKKAAASWWAERFQIPDRQEEFKEALFKRIKPDQWVLESDYDPQDELLEAIRDMGIECRGFVHSSDGLLPCKTVMIFRNGEILAKEGYGVPYEVIYEEDMEAPCPE